MVDINITNPERLQNPKWKGMNLSEEEKEKYQMAEDSIPKNPFAYNKPNDDGTYTEITVTEITLDYDENDFVRGWSWNN